MLDLRILEHFRKVVDGTARYPGGLERRDPVPARARAHDRGDDGHEHEAVADAIRIGAEAGIDGQLRPSRHLAEGGELPIVADGEDQVAVRAAKHLVGDDVGVRVPVARGNRAGAPVVEDLDRVEGDDRVQQPVDQQRHEPFRRLVQ